MAWWHGPLVGLDLETTAADPQEARIVTAALVVVHPHGDGWERPVDRATWLADPGVAIPEEATAVHGVTTERAQAEGRRASDVVREVFAALADATADGEPLVVYNARYDLTVLARECARHAPVLVSPQLREPLLERVRVVDPFVLDKHLDRYRKSYPPGHDAESAKAAGVPSSRTLEGMCWHYCATLDGAHDAAFDALAAVRLAWRMCSRSGVVRRVRNARDAHELAAMRDEWQEVREDLDALHEFQRRLALEERERFAEYKASIGEHDEAARIRAEVGWPVLEPVAA